LGFILLRRKSKDWFGLYLALAFFNIGRNTGTAIQPAIAVFPALDFLFHGLLGAVSWQFFFIAFFLFPTGRPVPAWTRWIVAGLFICR
jgi:hypothetical protein